MSGLRVHNLLAILACLGLAGPPCEGIVLCVGAQGGVELAYAPDGQCCQTEEAAAHQVAVRLGEGTRAREDSDCVCCVDLPIPSAAGTDLQSAPAREELPRVGPNALAVRAAPAEPSAETGRDGLGSPRLSTDQLPVRFLRTVVLLL